MCLAKFQGDENGEKAKGATQLVGAKASNAAKHYDFYLLNGVGYISVFQLAFKIAGLRCAACAAGACGGMRLARGHVRAVNKALLMWMSPQAAPPVVNKARRV